MFILLPILLILFVMAIVFAIVRGTIAITMLTTLGVFAIIAIALLT